MQDANVAVKGRLDIGRCFNDAIEVYKNNLPTLLLSTFLLLAISLVTLFILQGVLSGGFFWMLLLAMRRPDKKVEIKDMFSLFKKFLPLTGLLLIEAALIFIGFFLLIVPGLFLATMWIFAFFLMVDKNMAVISSLKASWNIVLKKGFGMNLLLCVIYIAFYIGGMVPTIGWLINLFLVPLGGLVLTSGYIQQVSEDQGELTEILAQ